MNAHAIAVPMSCGCSAEEWCDKHCPYLARVVPVSPMEAAYDRWIDDLCDWARDHSEVKP